MESLSGINGLAAYLPPMQASGQFNPPSTLQPFQNDIQPATLSPMGLPNAADIMTLVQQSVQPQQQPFPQMNPPNRPPHRTVIKYVIPVPIIVPQFYPVQMPTAVSTTPAGDTFVKTQPASVEEAAPVQKPAAKPVVEKASAVSDEDAKISETVEKPAHVKAKVVKSVQPSIEDEEDDAPEAEKEKPKSRPAATQTHKTHDVKKAGSKSDDIEFDDFGEPIVSDKEFIASMKTQSDNLIDTLFMSDELLQWAKENRIDELIQDYAEHPKEVMNELRKKFHTRMGRFTLKLMRKYQTRILNKIPDKYDPVFIKFLDEVSKKPE